MAEVESGELTDWPKLAKGVRLCRLHEATLIIAKLDTLASDVAFVSALVESGVEFTIVDFQQADRLTVHISAAVVEHEGKTLSERTKAALATAGAPDTARLWLDRAEDEGIVMIDDMREEAAKKAEGESLRWSDLTGILDRASCGATAWWWPWAGGGRDPGS